MHVEGTYVRCNWIDPDEEEKRMNRWPFRVQGLGFRVQGLGFRVYTRSAVGRVCRPQRGPVGEVRSEGLKALETGLG